MVVLPEAFGPVSIKFLSKQYEFFTISGLSNVGLFNVIISLVSVSLVSVSLVFEY